MANLQPNKPFEGGHKDLRPGEKKENLGGFSSGTGLNKEKMGGAGFSQSTGMKEKTARMETEVRSIATEAKDRLSGFYENVKEKVGIGDKSYEDVRENVVAYVKENPGRTLLYAFGIGFVAGLILKR